MAPLFSVVTASYNRAGLLSRVFDSLISQTLKSFEWVVIDDGSTDNTEEVIRKFEKESFFKIKYIKTNNFGKASALNSSIQYCEGMLYLVIDSDDWCDANSLEVFYEEYMALPDLGEKHDDYFAISCLKRFKDGRIVGNDYANIKKYGLTYIDRLNKKIKGDKWECLVLDKIKDCYYPVVAGEKYMAPGYVWIKKASEGYKTIFLNKSLSTVDYQPDGISNNNIKHRLGSLSNTLRYYREFYELKSASYGTRGRYYANYVRFSTHASRIPKVSISLLPFLFVGLAVYVYDHVGS